MKSFALALVMTSLALFTSSVAQAACGQLEVSKGDIKIESGGKLAPAAVGAKICSGSTIISGKDSRAKIKMEDGNELNISPDSKIALENYQFVPAQNKKKVLLNILQGKVRATTKQENMYNDKSADGSDNSFQVKTKSAVAGVRGTDFLTGFDPKTRKSEVVTFRGKVEFGQPGPGGKILNSVQVGAGQKTEQIPGQPPMQPRAVPPKDLQQMNTETKADGPSSQPSGAGTEKKEGDSKSDKKGDDASGGDKQAGNGDSKGDKKNEDAKGGDKQAGNGDSNGDKKSGDAKGGDKQAGTGGDKKGGGDNSGPAAGPSEGQRREPASNSGGTSLIGGNELRGETEFRKDPLPAGGQVPTTDRPIIIVTPIGTPPPPPPLPPTIDLPKGPSRLQVKIIVKQ